MRLITTVLLMGIAHAGDAGWCQPSPVAGVDALSIQQAIDWGRSENPQPYRVFHVPGEGRNRHVVALVYTPSLRVALAARAAMRQAWNSLWHRQCGLLLRSCTSPCGGMCRVRLAGADSRPAVKATTPDGMVSVVALGTGGTQPTDVLDSAILIQLGGPLPFDDITHVVTYPLDLLRQDVDLVVFNRDNPSQLCVERGRILRSDTQRWR